MLKSIINIIIFLFVISILAYNIFNTKRNLDNYFIVDENIKTIRLINKDFDIYLENTLSYDNFDIIQNKIKIFNKNLLEIKNNKMLMELQDNNIAHNLNNLNDSINEKFKIINSVKSYRAVLNNSFRIIQRIKKQGVSDNFNTLYTTILTIDKNPEINIAKELKNLDLLKSFNKYDEYFVRHSKVILEYQLKLNKIKIAIIKLGMDTKLNNFHTEYAKFSRSSIENAQLSVGILFLLLVILILFYLIHEYKLRFLNRELFKFRNTIENSDNTIVITDANEVIKYVNEAFTKATGYTAEEALGQKPNILNSHKQSNEFYKELFSTIHSGQKWSGEFINRSKSGNLIYEKASITPVINSKGIIEEFIAIKLDITSETLKNQQLKENEQLLMQQSKMATMGEMIESIAHQWRQPLSMITTSASGIKVQKEFNMLTDEILLESCDNIVNSANHLSDTIDDFRSFLKPDKEKKPFMIKDTYHHTLKLIVSRFKNRDIEIIEALDNTTVDGYGNELVQVFMNILNNARDELEILDNQKRLIFIDIYSQNNKAIIKIKDNAGGIPDDIIAKIFDSHFTTKQDADGTGIGLYMSQKIIHDSCKGTLEVENSKYNYKGIEYKGAQFTILLPNLIT